MGAALAAPCYSAEKFWGKKCIFHDQINDGEKGPKNMFPFLYKIAHEQILSIFTISGQRMPFNCPRFLIRMLRNSCFSWYFTCKVLYMLPHDSSWTFQIKVTNINAFSSMKEFPGVWHAVFLFWLPIAKFGNWQNGLATGNFFFLATDNFQSRPYQENWF